MTEPDIGATVNEWVSVVRRARLPDPIKLIALLMASYADPDGTNIYGGVARLAIQSGHGYRTVQRELATLRDIGLIEPMSRKGVPRQFSTGYRLILAPDLLTKVDVPTPDAEREAIEQLAKLYRGKHRKVSPGKSARRVDDVQNDDSGEHSARHIDDVQNDDCTPLDDTTARHDPPPDLARRQTTLPITLPVPNPPSAEAGHRYLGTGSARTRVSNAKPNSEFDLSTRRGTDQARQAQADRLVEWMREHPESVVTGREAAR